MISGLPYTNAPVLLVFDLMGISIWVFAMAIMLTRNRKWVVKIDYMESRFENIEVAVVGTRNDIACMKAATNTEVTKTLNRLYEITLEVEAITDSKMVNFLYEKKETIVRLLNEVLIWDFSQVSKDQINTIIKVHRHRIFTICVGYFGKEFADFNNLKNQGIFVNFIKEFILIATNRRKNNIKEKLIELFELFSGQSFSNAIIAYKEFYSTDDKQRKTIDTLSYYQLLLSKNKLEKLIKKLIDNSSKYDPQVGQLIIAVSNQYETLRASRISGILSEDESNKRQSQIVERLTKLIDELLKTE